MKETMSETECILNGDQWIAMAALLVTFVGSVLSFIAARESRELKRGRKKVFDTEEELLKAILAIEGYQDYLEGVATEKGCRDYSQLFHDTIKQGRMEKFEDTIFLQKAELRNRRTHLWNKYRMR